MVSSQPMRFSMSSCVAGFPGFPCHCRRGYGTLELVELAAFEKTACHAALGYIKKNMHSASDRNRFIH